MPSAWAAPEAAERAQRSQPLKSLLDPGQCVETLLPFFLLPLAPPAVPAPPSRAAGESQGSTPLPGTQRA